MNRSRSSIKNQKGQGLTEYAIVLSLVALISIAAMTLFGGAIREKVGSLIGAITGDTSTYESANKNLDKIGKDTKKVGEKKLDGMKADPKDEFIGKFK